MPSHDDLLFAEHVVQAGFLTREEVEESLSVQQRMEEMGVHETLRNVLVKRGALREGDAAVVARNAGLRSGGEPIPGYTLESRLGAGAMGAVYKAWQKGMKRHVAIKILRRDLTDDPRQVERLQREASLVGKLDHPNIVRGLDSGETDGLVWFVMEIVEGETLRDRIRRLTRLAPDEAVRITRQLAEALEHAATHGIVHRDIKPGNILVAKDGTPRLTDYGLAKGESDDALTQLDATLGTPQYIAPEQARNPRDADVRSDIYSLGATLYAALTGHPPFAGETMAATLTKVLYERPKPIAEEAPDAPPALAYVVERMMAKDRRHRYQTPDELLRDLRALEEGRLVVPAGFKGDIGEFVETRRHRRMAALGAGLLAGAVALAAGVYVWERHAADQKRRDAAAMELASLRRRAGAPEQWDGGKIQTMLADLERFERQYAGTPAAQEALGDVDRWTMQEAELARVNKLQLSAGDADVVWPNVVAEVDRLEAELRDRPEATVARRRVAELSSDARARRDEHARRESESAAADAAKLPLEQAGRRFERLAETLRTRYYGGEPSPLVKDAAALETRFRAATAAVEARFADYVRAAADGVPRGEFRALEDRLQRADVDARLDEALTALLASLPPAGTRMSAVAARRDALRDQLVRASAATWEKVRREAEDLRARRDLAAAATTLDDFASRALDPERDRAVALRDELLRASQTAESVARLLADETAARFWEALGRRDTARARETLAELEGLAPATAASSNPAAEMVAQGRRLLDLVETRLWAAFRARVARSGVLEQGLHVRSGLRYQGVHGAKLEGRALSFVSENGQKWQVSLDDVALDDVVAYAQLASNDPDAALTRAALRIAEYVAPSEPAEGLKLLDAAGQDLDKARAAPGFQSLVARLSKLRSDRVDEARAEIRRGEDDARAIHARAKGDLAQGRYEVATQQFKSLLDVARYWRTDYVRRNRDEIQRERDAAEQGRRVANYAAHFPGAQFTQFADGAAEILFDFESASMATPEARKLLGLAEGRTEIASRPMVVADRPAVARATSAPGLPLVLDHVLEWRPADAGGRPRDFPVSIESPFSMRSKVSVAFLYRSDAPFFFAVSIGGVTAGVLSAPGEPAGGRGVEIWNAVDFTDPGKLFDAKDERHRASYLAKHPEALRKDGDRRLFSFEPGRAYRVEFVKDERRASLWVDGQLRFETEWHPPSQPGPFDGRIVLASFGPGEVDDVRIGGILDPEWLRGR
jgi:tRNA A-37 threonylcarbamoyl transferase component Bud32